MILSTILGSAYYVNQVDVINFDFNFTFQMDGIVMGGADGFAFVIQNQDLGAVGAYGIYTRAEANTILGKGIGYDGISRSLVVEFDTFLNDNDPSDHHISIQSR